VRRLAGTRPGLGVRLRVDSVFTSQTRLVCADLRAERWNMRESMARERCE